MVMLRRWSSNKGRMTMLVEVVSLMEGDWSCYGGGQFNRGRMVMLQRWSLMEVEWSCYGGGQFKGGRMLLQRRPV